MISFRFLASVFLLATGSASAQGWRFVSEPDRHEVDGGLVYAKRIASRADDGTQVTVHLAFFTSRSFRLEVIDQGNGPGPAYRTLTDAFRANGCAAGVNGGFFHENWRPAGLMITQGNRVNAFESAKLLSGVLYSDARGIHLVRRAQFQDDPGITALLQTGPYLVEHSAAVRGLSPSDPRRRTFIATDWRGRWVLGASVTPLTLAELGECLASSGALTGWTVDRAINLDGGSSTGFFFDRGAGGSPVAISPGKRVRNLLGIVPR